MRLAPRSPIERIPNSLTKPSLARCLPVIILMEPERTPYDLNFSILGIPVRVHPWFWLVTALFGSSTLNEGVSYLLLWILCVFFSILIHELGHVAAYALFG